MVLKSVGVLSCAKLMGVMYAAMGLIFGAFVSLFSVLGAVVAQQEQGANALGAVVFGVGSVIFLPIIYGIMGFIGGIISAAIYNVVAGVVGGEELNLEPTATQY
jgi:hypothetical protein